MENNDQYEMVRREVVGRLMDVQDENSLQDLLDEIHSHAADDLASEFGDADDLSEDGAEALLGSVEAWASSPRPPRSRHTRVRSERSAPCAFGSRDGRKESARD